MATRGKSRAQRSAVQGRPVNRVAGGRPDSRGVVRIYADIADETAMSLALMAVKRRLTRKALLELLILEAVRK